jgi:hypothetical protein
MEISTSTIDRLIAASQAGSQRARMALDKWAESVITSSIQSDRDRGLMRESQSSGEQQQPFAQRVATGQMPASTAVRLPKRSRHK